jgi:hypothetical protein
MTRLYPPMPIRLDFSPNCLRHPDLYVCSSGGRDFATSWPPTGRISPPTFVFLLQFMCARQAGETSMEHKDLNQSLAERRTRREHRLFPKRYRDIVPEPPAPLLPPGL